MNSLDTKYNFYLSQLPKVIDESGFVFSGECDSILFSCLMAIDPNVKFDIKAAFDSSTGMWHRRPCSKPCYPAHSKSTISRDMFIGILYYAYFKQRLDILEQVISYALSHNLIMGKGDLSRTIMTPALLSTFAWASYRLGGPSRWWLRMIPLGLSEHTTGYQTHLAVLHGLIRNKLEKKDKHLDLFRKHSKEQPNNALFQYAVGDLEKVYTILNSERYFPSDRLPNHMDRKPEYLWQRDCREYVSGTDNKVIAPADFIFMYNVVKRELL